MRLKNYQILIFTVLMTLFSCDEFNWDLKEKPLIEKVEIQAVDFTSCEVIVELKYIKSQKIGSEDVVELQFYSDTNDLAEKTLIKDNLTLGLNKFSISDLQASKHYFLKVVARNKVGETRSSFIYFQTLNIGALPTISTLSSSSITSNSAFLSGNLINTGSSAIISKGFCYSTSANPTVANNVVNVTGGSLGNFSATINGLSSNTVYYFRSFAINSSGVTYGNIMQFQTSSSLSIGQNYQGGTIGYLYQPGETGYVTGQDHGLIFYPHSSWSDLFYGPFSSWSCYVGALASGLGNDGESNTFSLVNGPGSVVSNDGAASVCYYLQYGGYNDWYLPSIGELSKIFQYQNINGVLYTASNMHWSSTEIDNNTAKAYDSYFLQNFNVTKQTEGYILPVRRF